MDPFHRELREQIVRYCAASPSAQHNGVACVNRAWNVSWRGMIREILTDQISALRGYLATLPIHMHVGEITLWLFDLEDVVR